MSLAKRVIRTTIILSTTTVLLASGCSDYKLLKIKDPTALKPIPYKADPYDSHYGLPQGNNKGGYATQAKYKKIRIPVKSDAPSRYKVKKGDTMWGIANKFLKDPWFWPEIWDKNQKVKNPHLIYPGDLLYIYQTRRTIKRNGGIVEVLVPQIRVERLGGGKPLSALAPFLAWPRVLDKETIERAPYIVDGQDQHLIIENGQTVYIKKLRDRTVGKNYPIFRKNKPLYNPETRELLGYEVIYTADASITRGRGEIATATILNAKREVHKGDRLLKNIDEKVVLNTPMLAPKHKVRATILSLYEAHMISGTGMIIVLDRGATKGIKPGYVLGIYKPGKTVSDPYEKKEEIKYKYLKRQVAVKVGLPPERIATAVVYKVNKQLSYALITDSVHAVKKGYKIGNP
ncbi:MAG: LysM peptidoglycan-binding domain-containing protein [Cocleimonas sp.]|nr:LysM peptidoglycan-binding domain-containing protein [Cocleimonas sp.]